ncbi:MAG: hypothetical protein ACPGQL_07210 [Thermoplasmatota archaeon]
MVVVRGARARLLTLGVGLLFVTLLLGQASGLAVQLQRLSSPDAEAYDQFGQSVDIWGDTMAIGEPEGRLLGYEEGKVHIYKRQPGELSWSLYETLVGPPGSLGFGTSLDLAGDSHLIVGAPSETVLGQPNAGAVYAYFESGGEWFPAGRLVSPDPGPHQFFGTGLAHVGDQFFIGEPRTLFGGDLPGQVHHLTWGGNGQVHLATYRDPDPPYLPDLFGSDVALDETTLNIAIGAPRSLRVQILEYQSGSGWNVQTTFSAPSGQVVGHSPFSFGAAVDLEGDLLIVGAPDAYTSDIDEPEGWAYVFHHGSGGWDLEAVLEPTGPFSHWPGKTFGSDVAIFGDAVAVGASHAANQVAPFGSAYLFKRTVGGDWIEREEYIPAAPGYDTVRMGASIGFHDQTIVAGAPLEKTTVPSNPQLGAAYVFRAACMDVYGTFGLAPGQLASLPFPCVAPML